MLINPPSPIKVLKKYQPRGFEIIYEDRDIIVGNKAAGFLTVAALWNKETTIHRALNLYVRKGQARSHKRVYVVHRLDQDTTGVLVFAKTPQAMTFLKENWKSTQKIYRAIVHGVFKEKQGLISSYLKEDDEYVVHSSSDPMQGQLSSTAYRVIKETDKYSLLEIDLLTGRKNQIRVHMAAQGHPVLGDSKYGKDSDRHASLALHAYSLEFTHPFLKERLRFVFPAPEFFSRFFKEKDKNSELFVSPGVKCTKLENNKGEHNEK